MSDPHTLSLSQQPWEGVGLPRATTGSAWKSIVSDTLENARTAYSEHLVPEEDSDLLFRRGKSYFFGDGVPQNYGEALALFWKAAAVGHSEAQFFVGECHAFGLGVAVNEGEAADWYRKSSDLGNTEAMLRLGDYCHYRCEAGEADRAQEARWYQRAADLGNSSGMRRLADCYHGGRGLTRDYGAAVRWYRKAAEQGNAEACDSLGDCYYYGRGVAQSYAEAVTWYERGNRPGFQSVRYSLALFCTRGTQAHAEVISHLKSVSDGYERCLLGCLLAPDDRLEAYLWFRPAADEGNDSAQESLRTLVPRMTAVELQAGEALCRPG